MSKIVLAKNEIKLGQPLPWSVYAPQGHLLLKKGSVITSAFKLKQLLSQKPLRDESIPVDDVLYPSSISASKEDGACSNTDIQNPFSCVDLFVMQVNSILGDAVLGKEGVGARFSRLAAGVQSLVSQDADACLGAITIYNEHSPLQARPIYVAMLCELVGQALDYSEQLRLSIISAALSCKPSAVEGSERQAFSASTNQQYDSPNQTYVSSDILKSCGIDDPVWLEAVLHQCEVVEGVGYHPSGFKSPEIPEHARVLAVASHYFEMIKPADQTKGMPPRQALQKLLHCCVEQDKKVVMGLVKQLGVFPPGSVVKLANNEAAIVTHRDLKSPMPRRVASVIGSSGQAFSLPLRRDVDDSDYRVKEIFSADKLPKLNPSLLWGYG